MRKVVRSGWLVYEHLCMGTLRLSALHACHESPAEHDCCLLAHTINVVQTPAQKVAMPRTLIQQDAFRHSDDLYQQIRHMQALSLYSSCHAHM